MSLFQKIDKKVEAEIQRLESRGKIPSLSDLFPDVHEERIRLLNLGLNVLLVSVPLTFLGALFFSNLALKGEIDVYSRIIQGVEQYQAYKSLLSDLEKQIVSQRPITSKEGLLKDYQGVLAQGGKTRGAVKVGDFQQVPKGETLVLTEGEINFSNLSQLEFSKLLKKSVVEQKMKIRHFEIVRHKEEGRLQGKMAFSHYGRP